jgi:hypothetical protein
VLTPFFWKNWSKRDKEEQSMKNRVQSADWRKKRTINTIRRWSEGSNHDSGPVGQSNRPMVSREIDRWRKEKAVIKEVREKESNGGGGSVHDWQRVKSQFLQGLRLMRESFSIFSSFLSLDASKQCRNWLGVGFVPRT